MKKLMMLVTIVFVSFDVSANNLLNFVSESTSKIGGWFSDTPYEQGYDAGVNYGFDLTVCSRNKPKNYDHFISAIMTKEGDWIGKVGDSLIETTVSDFYLRDELGPKISLNGKEASKEDIKDLRCCPTARNSVLGRW